ncbi:MAG: hypothetical protein GXP16_15370, partial [Gammaproteobacteria bacterium]|nr:hypothetical protein [Gammaproteobacteria bacterium]
MRWLSFERNGEVTFGYVTADGSGVVDVGQRSSYGSLLAAIEADALAGLPGQCGDDADIALDNLHYAPTITQPK